MYSIAFTRVSIIISTVLHSRVNNFDHCRVYIPFTVNIGSRSVEATTAWAKLSFSFTVSCSIYFDVVVNQLESLVWSDFDVAFRPGSN